MKRVLLINTASTSFNGITSVIMNYVRKTHDMMEYDFVLCGNVEEKFKNELQCLGKNVFIPPCSRSMKPFAYTSWLKSIMKREKYDVVHVHGNSATMFFDFRAAKAAKIPIRIAHSHSTSCKHMLAHRILKPWLNRDITHAIACSDMAGKWLFNRDFRVLQNGIDINKFAFSESVRNEYRSKLGLEGKLVIGHIGYMDVEKNHIFLLRVFKRLIERNKDARLLLIGDGRLRGEIEQFILENKMNEYVLTLGKRADVANLYQCMDVFALPSLFEGLPVTLVEAQTAGLPCVVSDAVTRQVNVTGNIKYIAINDDNIDEWVNCLSDISLCNKNRSESLEYMQNSEFNIEKCIESLYNIYRNEI